MKIHDQTWTRRAAAVACLAALALVVAACGSKSSATTVGPSPQASPAATPSQSPEAAVKQAWQTFFAGTTAAAQKIALLQNGQQFAATIRAQAASPLAKATQAKVTSVRVTSPTTAVVTFSIVQGGQVALPHMTGQAVLQGGSWKVGARTFQDLLQLEQGQGGQSASPSP